MLSVLFVMCFDVSVNAVFSPVGTEVTKRSCEPPHKLKARLVAFETGLSPPPQ